MVFVGIDSLPHEGVAYVKQGILTATFQYPTGGGVAIMQALKIFAGAEGSKEDCSRVADVHEGQRRRGGEAIP